MIEITTSLLLLVSSLYGGLSGASVAAASQNKVEPILQRQERPESIENDNPITFEQYVREYFKDNPILAEIAKCESTFRQYDSDGEVIKGKINKNDIGVMQINKHYHLERANKLGFDLNTIEGNMAYAKKLYESEGTKPWKSSSNCWEKYAQTNGDSVNG
ncbi:MAG: hypothetical protein KGJ58_01655 [Patescibacteria group bacterium]|nr:hypothetical protein [Patescibacteria group bacterium]MDE1988646.1 hypothetical protein [Patescibacteria group bacterium]MDE2218144.1 hypothetical protein [Patescibacteria group bacterium]